MLQSMREKVQGIIAVSIVALVSLTFAMWGIQNYLRSRGGGDVVAKVNGAKVTRNQFHNIYDRARQRLMMQMGKDFIIDQQMQSKLKQQVLQQLIKTEAIFQAAKKMGFRINPAQINEVLTHLPAFQEGGHFSPSRFQQVLSGMLYSEGEFIADMQRSMTLNQLQSGIITSTFILPGEVDNIVKLLKQTRDIGYAIIPVSKFINVVKVSDTDIQNYYQQNQPQFQTPEKVSLAFVELAADSLKGRVKINDQEIRQYYNDNIDIYSHPARWYVARIFIPVPADATSRTIKKAKAKIDALAKKAQSGVGFVKLDATYGKPVWLVQGELTPDFVKQLKQLKTNEISASFRTENGFYVVKLLQYKAAQVLPFNKVQKQVKEALIQQKTTQLFDQENDKLSDLTYTDSNSLQTASKQLGLPIQTTGLFTAQVKKAGILSNPKVKKAAFSDTVLQQKYNSDVIEIAPGKVIVLRVKQHIPAATKPLAQVKATIEQQLKTKAAIQKAQDLGQTMLTDIQQGKSARKIAVQNNLTWKAVAKVEPQMKKVQQQILMAAFSLPLPRTGKPSVTGAALDNGYAIVQVTKVYPGDVSELTKKQRQFLERQLETAMGQIDYDTLAEKIVKKASIKIFVENEG